MQVSTRLNYSIRTPNYLPHMNFCFHLSSKLCPNKASFDTCLNTNVKPASLTK